MGLSPRKFIVEIGVEGDIERLPTMAETEEALKEYLLQKWIFSSPLKRMEDLIGAFTDVTVREIVWEDSE